MMLVDANLLIYAYAAELPQHAAAHAWLDRAGRHCQAVTTYLFDTLHITECQVDELWSFVRVVFQKWRWSLSYCPPKSIAVDKQADDEVVHLYRFREADRLANQPFDARP